MCIRDIRGVFPIKVNQQQHTVEKIAQFGSRFHHGLEVGSKAELISAISQLKDPEACLICNGYKDEEFIDLGLSAVRMGFKCIFVMEMPGELELILERSAALGVRPLDVYKRQDRPCKTSRRLTTGSGTSSGRTSGMLSPVSAMLTSRMLNRRME